MEAVMKLGMTFEGGANRAIFSCGVIEAFLEEGLMPDYFIGVSAGIAYGVSYLSRQAGRNWEITQKYIRDKRYMGIHHLFNKEKKSYFNVDFVFTEIPDKLVPFDYDAFAEYPGEVTAAVTNIHSGKAEYLQVPRGREMNQYLVASCSLPVMFQPVKIGRHYYLDGAIADPIPFEQPMKAGCDKNIVVLTRSRDYIKPAAHMMGVAGALYKHYPRLLETLEGRTQYYNESIEKIHALEQEEKLFVIAPDQTFGVGRVESDLQKLRRLYDEGYRIAKEQMPKIRAYLEK